MEANKIHHTTTKQIYLLFRNKIFRITILINILGCQKKEKKNTVILENERVILE